MVETHIITVWYIYLHPPFRKKHQKVGNIPYILWKSKTHCPKSEIAIVPVAATKALLVISLKRISIPESGFPAVEKNNILKVVSWTKWGFRWFVISCHFYYQNPLLNWGLFLDFSYSVDQQNISRDIPSGCPSFHPKTNKNCSHSEVLFFMYFSPPWPVEKPITFT